MKVICVDDERKIMEYTVAMCRRVEQVSDVAGFTNAKDTLEFLRENPVDIAILDIDMPDVNGITLAARIKELHPDAQIVFLTGYSEFALDAFKVRASGYLLKPVTQEQLAEEIEYAQSAVRRKRDSHIRVQTFGGFDIFIDGEIVTFKQAKCKELLAYLIDRNGSSVTRQEAFAVLYEDREYDRPMQKQLDVIIRSLRQTCIEYGIENILDVKKGIMRILPEEVDCDAYRFFRGDIDAVNEFRGEYMTQYSWASITEGYIDSEKERIERNM